jgi:uncharacterized membrane protein YfcA
VGGFLGIGGGVVLVPFLTIVFQMPIHHAVALSLATIMANSLTSSTEYLQGGMVDIKMVIMLSIYASIGAVAGSIIGYYISPRVIQVAFAILLVYTTIAILTKSEKKSIRQRGLEEIGVIKIASIAILSGIISSLLGVGGGVLIIPALYLIFDYPLDLAKGTSAFTIGIIATAGSIVYLVHGTLSVECAGPIMLGTMAGGWLGSKLGIRTKSGYSKAAFSLLLIYLAVKMIWHGAV